jgi:glutathione S-transferase
MTDKLKLTYFDAPVSRGEECRLALYIAGVEFEDARIKPADWPALKASTPFGGIPTLEVPGKGVLAESNAILVYIGRRWGLHPKDDYEAARHEMMMSHVESLRGAIIPTMSMPEDEKKAKREALVASALPAWAAAAARQLGDGPFFAGDQFHVVDLKIWSVYRWIASGKLDHIPATLFTDQPKLARVHDAVNAHPRVKAWYARA